MDLHCKNNVMFHAYLIFFGTNYYSVPKNYTTNRNIVFVKKNMNILVINEEIVNGLDWNEKRV